MKVTVTLLSNKNNVFYDMLDRLKNSFIFVINNFALISGCTLICFALGILARYIRLPKQILNLATNFRIENGINVSVKDLMSINSIFNAKNYLMKKEDKKVEEVVIDATKEEKLKKLDALAEDKTEKEVFANKSINMEITQNTEELQRISLANMKILNYSSKRNIDYSTLTQGSVILTKASDHILIYNTHTSESYANSENYQFEYSGVRRSRDASFNMLAVANEFMQNLKSKGFNVTHNTTPHDYGTYDSAYSRSRITVEDALKKDPEVGLSIDLHRDAIEDLDFAPAVNINGVDVAQCMLVIGVGYDDDSNPYFEDNLSLALKLQYIADEVYPGLFRPMIIRNSVYNQDLNKYSILIEVGASGNTFDEAFFATRCLANLLNIIYKD